MGFTLKRETLRVCQNSFLAHLFSGHLDESLQKDHEGNVFLDFDPSDFEIILSWLRDRKIESPDRPASSPIVSKEELPHFQVVADYLGLRPCLDVDGFGSDGWGPVAIYERYPGDSDTDVQNSDSEEGFEPPARDDGKDAGSH